MRHVLAFLLFCGAAYSQVAPAAFSGEGTTPPPGSFEASRPGTAPISSPGNALPDLLPQPVGKPTLIGGTIARTDRVRDELTIHIFGGGNTRVLFDGRTHIYHDGQVSSVAALADGQRVYVDTMRAGRDVFARNIRILTQVSNGQSVGQVAEYNSATGELLLNDRISPQQVRIHVSPTTKLVRDGKDAGRTELRSGALVSVTFSPDGKGQSLASQIAILAAPGNGFVFAGRVTHLDMRLGLLVVEDPRDQKTYEVYFDPHNIASSDALQEGAIVEATTTFNGFRYVASNIKINSNPRP